MPTINNNNITSHAPKARSSTPKMASKPSISSPHRATPNQAQSDTISFADSSFSDFFKLRRIKESPSMVVTAAIKQLAVIELSVKARVELFTSLASVNHIGFYTAWVEDKRAMETLERWLKEGIEKMFLRETLLSILSVRCLPFVSHPNSYLTSNQPDSF
jgi:hypothetical protein